MYLVPAGVVPVAVPLGRIVQFAGADPDSASAQRPLGGRLCFNRCRLGLWSYVGRLGLPRRLQRLALLYDVPVELGWLDAPVPEPELNPISIFF